MDFSFFYRSRIKFSFIVNAQFGLHLLYDCAHGFVRLCRRNGGLTRVEFIDVCGSGGENVGLIYNGALDWICCTGIGWAIAANWTGCIDYERVVLIGLVALCAYVNEFKHEFTR